MYSIGEVSKIMNLSISTLRYYDSSGVMPSIKRNRNGIREFSDNDLEALRVIECLKISGLQLKDIKIFMKWCKEGDKTINKRLMMFIKQEEAILKQIDDLNKALNMIKFKKWYYSTALNDKKEDKLKNMKFDDFPKEVKELYKKAH